MVINSQDLFTLSTAGVKHANTVHILDFDGPKQAGECNDMRQVHDIVGSHRLKK